MIVVKAAIFDTDGTLVDTTERFFQVLNQLIAESGRKPISWDEFRQKYVEDTLDDVVVPSKEKNRDEKLHKFWMEFLRRYRDGNACGKLIPGVENVFKKLHRKGVPVAVITSCIVPPEKLKSELASYGLAEFVKIIATAHDVVKDLESGHHFSKVEILRLAAKKLGVAPNDCVVVGDYWNDIRDAKAMGARTVGVLTGDMRKEVLSKYGPDAVVDSVRELFDVVEFEPK
jgi:phosphoglycolate phosphatase